MEARKKFRWIDPTTDKKYKDICTTPDFLHLLEDVIEDEEQAESFFEAYSEVSDDAEYNIGHFADLIKDPDVREDVLDLFQIDPNVNYLSPKRALNREYSLSVWVRNG